MEYTIEITQYCENGCWYCSTNASSEGKHLPLRDILEFLGTHHIGPTDRINISGGEPLAHPDFYRILKECYNRTFNVWVYTNALNQIKYNAHVLPKGIKTEANICLCDGCFEDPITIPKGTKMNLLKFVSTGRGSNIDPLDVHVSGNVNGHCLGCEHVLLQADGETTEAPCKKHYGG